MSLSFSLQFPTLFLRVAIPAKCKSQATLLESIFIEGNILVYDPQMKSCHPSSE